MKKKKIIKKKSSKETAIDRLVDFLWEWRILKYIPRASMPYLKDTVRENVAEHSFYATIIGWILAQAEKADENKVIKMCLLHDLAEARGGERNLLNKFYSQPLNEPSIIREITRNYKMQGVGFDKLFDEFFQEKTLEAKIARDADILEEMVYEKECFDKGNKKAAKWLAVSLHRLKTKSAKELGERIVESDADKWWVEIARQYILHTKFL
ncbi:HD domain-containing protein [bacterium]|nr:HD domain-containing protein [bacterium]